MESEPLSSFKISREAKKKLKDKEYLKRQLAKGKTARQILGVSHASMVEFYEAAFHLFENERYEDAANAFLFLITLDPHNGDYWLGLGMSAQQEGHINEAIDSYELAAYYQPDNPVPYFYLVKCFFLIKDRASALEALNLAVEYASDYEEWSELKEHALEAKSLLHKKN